MNWRKLDEPKDKVNHDLEEAALVLRRMNDDLKQFAYAASHDLQERCVRLLAIQSFW